MGQWKSSVTVAVIGTGLAGMAASRRLVEAGLHVRLFDKGRRPGGRMASRGMALPDGTRAQIDHGAQFVTARDPRFRDFLDGSGAVAWPEAGEGRFVGVPGNRALMERGLEGLDCAQGVEVISVSRTAEGWYPRTLSAGRQESAGPFDAVICTVPAVQAARLFPDAAQALSTVRMAPCWAALLVFDTPLAEAPAVLSMPDDAAVLSWAAREGSKPGRAAAPERWILHAGPAWSRRHLEDDPDAVLAALLQAFARCLGVSRGNIPEPTVAQAHRWRFARVEDPLGVPYLAAGDGTAILAGDWCLGGRAEAAYLSGLAAAEALLGAPEERL